MQRYRTVIILVLLVAVPLIATVAAVRFLLPSSGDDADRQAGNVTAAAPAPKKKQKTRKILAAARNLPVGTLLRE